MMKAFFGYGFFKDNLFFVFVFFSIDFCKYTRLWIQIFNQGAEF